MHIRSKRLTTAFTGAILVAACAPVTNPTPRTSPSSELPAVSSSASPSMGPATAPSPSPATSAAADPSGQSGTRWVKAGRLNEARNAANVVVLGGGKVLVVGSDYQTSWLSACGAATSGSDSVEIGDPDMTSWDVTAGLRTPREAPAVVALNDGRALMTGGERGEDDGNISYSSTYVFDVENRVWARSGLMNTARSNPAAAVLADGRVIVAGGRYIDKTHRPRILDSSETWDPKTGVWSRTGPLAESRWGASAVTLSDGRVLIVGGGGSPRTAPAERSSAEIYDPGAGSWTPAGRLAVARSGFILVALSDGGAIVAGGLNNPRYGRLASVERFDPTSRTWSPAADLPYAVVGASGVRLADGRVLVAGGSINDPEIVDDESGTYVSGLTKNAVLFDPASGTWEATLPLPSRRAGASAVLLADGSALLVGGSVSEGNPADTPSCPEADPDVLRYVPGR
jgi:hypothetical protein